MCVSLKLIVAKIISIFMLNAGVWIANNNEDVVLYRYMMTNALQILTKLPNILFDESDRNQNSETILHAKEYNWALWT